MTAAQAKRREEDIARAQARWVRRILAKQRVAEKRRRQAAERAARMSTSGKVSAPQQATCASLGLKPLAGHSEFRRAADMLMEEPNIQSPLAESSQEQAIEGSSSASISSSQTSNTATGNICSSLLPTFNPPSVLSMTVTSMAPPLPDDVSTGGTLHHV